MPRVAVAARPKGAPDPSAQLYNLVLGTTVSLLRERAGLRQNEMADRLGLTKQKVSRLARGLASVDAHLLQGLGSVLGLKRERLLSLTDAGMTKTRDLARKLGLSAKDWGALRAKLGESGAGGLVAVAVAVVLSGADQRKRAS